MPRSLLGFAEFRKGGSRLLYVVRLLATVVVVEATIPGGDLSAFDMGTEATIIALEGRLPPDTFGAYVTFSGQQSATEDPFEGVPSHFPGGRTSCR